MRAVLFDFDSTVVTKESLDETIAYALATHPERDRVVREIEEITNLGMEGKLPFTQSVTKRLATISLACTDFEIVGKELKKHITTGMQDVFAELEQSGTRTYIVSGGFRESVAPTARALHVPEERVLTNIPVFDTHGTFVHPLESSLLWTDSGKTAAIQVVRARDDIAYAVLVGDGANDLAAYTAGAVDMFVGFGANVVREAVKSKAPMWASSSDELVEHLGRLLAQNA